VAGQTELGIMLVAAQRAAFAARLGAMTPQEQRDLVDAARRETGWPPGAWLREHARVHGHGRSPEQYAAWAQNIKNRSGTQVYAMIHASRPNEGLAFINPAERSLVWFQLSEHRNFSCFYLDETVDAFVAQKGDLYWRLGDTELP